MIFLDHRDARPIYRQIVEGVRQQILAGALQPEDRLPSVRELAAALSINPNTIQRAYRELEQDGWVRSIPGKGCFVCPRPREEAGRQELLAQFDEVAKRLIDGGVSPMELIARLTRMRGE